MSETLKIRIGWALTGLFALFMAGASITPKLMGMDVAAQSMQQLGWPTGYTLMIGGFELVFLVLYLVPRTNVLGAILMSILIGGAMASQIRVGNPLFTNILFSVYLCLFMWGGLWLRDPALRAIFPVRR